MQVGNRHLCFRLTLGESTLYIFFYITTMRKVKRHADHCMGTSGKTVEEEEAKLVGKTWNELSWLAQPKQ